MRLACPGLLSTIESGAAVVTPNSFVAAVAMEQFSQYQLARGLETWKRPVIQSLDTWLAGLWQEIRYSGHDVPSLLSPSQELALWKRIIEQEHPELFDSSATASLARHASRLLAEWHIPIEGDGWAEHQDAQQFQRWLHSFRYQCNQQDWITRADLWRLIPGWIAEGWAVPGSTAFAAFEFISPALEKIMATLGSRASLESTNLSKPRRRARVVSLSDFDHEIEYAARTARACFEENSCQSLGVLVAGLPERVPRVQRTFEHIFRPSSTLQFLSSSHPASGEYPFHIQPATRLIDHPLVAGALLLLELARPRIDHAHAGAILRSSFVAGAATERSARALADVELQKKRELDVSLLDMQYAARNCPGLAPVWSKLQRLLNLGHESALRELPQWSQFIGDLLEAVGWPGENHLSFREQIVVEAWRNGLSTLSSLGLVSVAVTYDGAIAQFKSLLSASIEYGDWSSPIQILDTSRAANIQFDRAIIVGLSDEGWPPPISISSLIPYKLQRACDVPGSWPQSAREQRDRLTESVFQAAPEVIATFSGQLSPLAEKFVRGDRSDLPIWQGRLPIESFAAASLEQLEDAQAPPVSPSASTPGGANVIKAQSQCPFRAFAEHRLHARSLEDASFGLDALERGRFAHKALEEVWRRLESQNRLKATPDNELREIVRSAVEEAVEINETGPLHALATQSERERLEELILCWLALERSRRQPFIVENVEQKRSFEAKGLHLELRVDRMDRLRNGALVLIDYKTGQQTKTKLDGVRPAEPQLLVYAASLDEPVEGIFFGQLKPREVKAVGYSRDKHFSSPTALLKKDWSSYIENARSIVEGLAGDFVNGAAAVQPIKGACEYCGIKPLCRIHQNPSLQEQDE